MGIYSEFVLSLLVCVGLGYLAVKEILQIGSAGLRRYRSWSDKRTGLDNPVIRSLVNSGEISHRAESPDSDPSYVDFMVKKMSSGDRVPRDDAKALKLHGGPFDGLVEYLPAFCDFETFAVPVHRRLHRFAFYVRGEPVYLESVDGQIFDGHEYEFLRILSREEMFREAVERMGKE